jgi:SAM-dependent methyltransferase
VTGVDIAEYSIKKACERAVLEGIEDRVEFRVGDAHNLPFKDGVFDVVITEFVAQFLDNEKAFTEFARVLKKGGYYGIDELYKDEDMSDEAFEKIKEVEELITRLTSLPFTIKTPKQWRQYFEKAGFTKIEMVESHDYMGLRDTPHIIKEIGGIRVLAKTFYLMVRLYLSSPIARERFNGLTKVKSVLLRKKSTKKHIGYILGIGRKE